MKILVSILVHEAPATLRDQALNYERFMPNALMVVHVSETSNVDISDFESATRGLSNVILNPNRMPTVWGDVLGPHLLNLKFAARLEDFDRFCIVSSQDLFFRMGVCNRLQEFEAGYDYEKVVHDWSAEAFLEQVAGDLDIQKMFNDLDVREVIWSQVDGSFYPWSFASELVGICDKYLDCSSSNGGYFREEIVPQTLFHNLYPNAKKCYPYVLRIASFNYWLQEQIRYFTKNSNVRRAAAHLFRYRYPRFYNMRIYNDLCAGNIAYMRKYEFLKGRRHIDLDGVYGLKRVASDLNDPVRVSVRNYDK